MLTLTRRQPIQRVCKYPLLFAELLKYTPVSDCPNSHMEVDGVLTRLREATAEINRATNDSQMKATLERSWLLQDRLQFPSKVMYLALLSFYKMKVILILILIFEFTARNSMPPPRIESEPLATSDSAARCTSVGRQTAESTGTI